MAAVTRPLNPVRQNKATQSTGEVRGRLEQEPVRGSLRIRLSPVLLMPRRIQIRLRVVKEIRDTGAIRWIIVLNRAFPLDSERIQM